MGNCKTCRWFHAVGASPNKADECRRHAPVMWIRPNYTGPYRFPIMGRDDWCGDHEPSPERTE